MESARAAGLPFAGPLIAGTLIVALGGFGNAAIVGLFFIIGAIGAPFLPETKAKPLLDVV